MNLLPYSMIKKQVVDFVSAVWLHFWYVVLGNMVVAILRIAIEKTIGISLMLEQNQDYQKTQNYLAMSILIAPILEELVFRLHLSQKNQHFVISISLFIFLSLFFWNKDVLNWRDLDTQVMYINFLWIGWLYLRRDKSISF